MQLLHKWLLKGTNPLPAGRGKQVKVSQRELKSPVSSSRTAKSTRTRCARGQKGLATSDEREQLAVQLDPGKVLSLCISVQHVGADWRPCHGLQEN